MQKWDYLVRVIEPHKLELFLKNAGQNGWELVEVIQSQVDQWTVICKGPAGATASV